MQKHCGCQFSFPPAIDNGMLIMPIEMEVLRPGGNGSYILPMLDITRPVDGHDKSPFALVSLAHATPRHNRLGHLHRATFTSRPSMKTVLQLCRILAPV
jgi:hypothetical protein